MMREGEVFVHILPQNATPPRRRIAGHRGGRQARRHAGPRRFGRAGQAGCRRGSVAGQARRQPIRFGRASLIARTIAAPGLTSRTGRGVIRSAACGRLPTPCPRAMAQARPIGRMRVHLHVQFHHDRQQAARQRLAGVAARVVGRQARSESRALACWRRLRATGQRDQRPQRRGQRLVQIGQPQGQRIGLEDVRCLARRARACCRSW